MKLTHIASLVALALTLTACGKSGEEHAHTHGDDHAHPHSHDEHDHVHGDGEGQHTHEKKTPGPNGGRLITTVSPQLEFLVTEDRKVRVTAVDENVKPIPMAGQTVSLVGGDRSAPTDLSFEAEGDSLISTVALPKGNDVPVILTILPTAESQPVLERFNVNFSTCPTCDYQEYACICGH